MPRRSTRPRRGWTGRRPAVEVDRLIRGLSPFPGAWCEIGGERVKLLLSELAEGAGAPGEVLDGRLAVACGAGAVRLLRLQRAGGGVLDAAAFLRGRPVRGGRRGSVDSLPPAGESASRRGRARTGDAGDAAGGFLRASGGCGAGRRLRRRAAADGPSAAMAPEPGMVPVPNAGFDAWVAGFRGRALAQGVSPGDVRRGLRAGGIPAGRDRAGPQPDRVHPDDGGLSGDRRVGRAGGQGTGGAGAARRRRSRRSRGATGSSPRWSPRSGGWRASTASGGAACRWSRRWRRWPTRGGGGASSRASWSRRLKILQNGDVAPAGMTGSWAGAMGHTQFIPTSYLAYAVDFTGDGRRDIWSDDPTDALARRRPI